MDLFPVAPQDLTALGDEELGDLLASFQNVSRQLRAGEIDLSEAYPDMSEDERSEAVMTAWREAATIVQAIRAEQAARVEAAEAFAAQAEELHAAFEEDEEAAVEAEPVEMAAAESEDDDEEKAEEDEEALASEEAEVVTASTAPRVRYPAVAKRHEAPPAGASLTQLVASIGGDTVRPGQALDNKTYARLAVEVAKRRGRPQHVSGGGRERILLASADYDFPGDMTLSARDPEGNAAKLAAVGNPYLGPEAVKALVASGGICAPPTPFYDLPQLSTTVRPVRDSLPSFRADRGGVSVPSVSTLGGAAGAITVIEASEDEAGGTAATKSCLNMACATWTDTFIGIISHCREVGNLNARTWPEGVAHENENTMAIHSRTAEGRLLDRIDSLSLNLSRAAVYGASSTLLYALQVSRVGIISRLRMPTNTRFNVILPFYAAEMFSLDLVNGQFGRFDTPPEQVGALLSRFGFNVTWHLDEGIDPAAANEVWPDESDDTEQNDWPGSSIVARLYPAGHFVHLDGGTLELGLVRDSELNSTNDFELFGETFENVFAVGPTQAAHRLAITICPDGTVAAPATAMTCSGT